MASAWFVRGGGKVYGPLNSPKLKRLAEEGKIDRQTEVATSAAGPWHAASHVKGLFSDSASPRKTPALTRKNEVASDASDAAIVPAAAGSEEPNGYGAARESESFGSWYRRTVGSWGIALQILAWLCGGYIFFPVWWALAGDKSQLRIAKLLGTALAVLLMLLAAAKTWEFLDPEGAKQFRERNAQAAAERREKAATAKAEKGKMKGAHVAAGLAAIDLKNSGAIRPRGDALNALARRVASTMDVPSERRDEFVRDFEWAFNIAWDKSN